MSHNRPQDVASSPVPAPNIGDSYAENFGDTCCGKCRGASCYVDLITGER